ncbi:hypothetical protein [Peribacillus sp. SCS-155]|uniref:hypothetical protein n=1 Tax=Peribacillus sedimenti TaxID=3115297 RepID=UPI0039059FC4
MKELFIFNGRIGIDIPKADLDWENLDADSQQEILVRWEKIRGTIPDRIKELERNINEKQERLNDEEDFSVSCTINTEIAELASIINELWLWYRINQNISYKLHI